MSTTVNNDEWVGLPCANETYTLDEVYVIETHEYMDGRISVTFECPICGHEHTSLVREKAWFTR